MADPIVANVVVSAPSQLFTMPREFKSVFNGMIYIGKIDTDPTITANQIQVYLENEDGSLVPMPQPIRTNAGGYPVYNGKVSKFVTVQGHSMLIQDANGVQLFYFPNVLKYDPDQFAQRLSSPDGASLVHYSAHNVSDIELSKYLAWKNGDITAFGGKYADNTAGPLNKAALSEMEATFGGVNLNLMGESVYLPADMNLQVSNLNVWGDGQIYAGGGYMFYLKEGGSVNMKNFKISGTDVNHPRFIGTIPGTYYKIADISITHFTAIGRVIMFAGLGNSATPIDPSTVDVGANSIKLSNFHAESPYDFILFLADYPFKTVEVSNFTVHNMAGTFINASTTNENPYEQQLQKAMEQISIHDYTVINDDDFWADASNNYVTIGVCECWNLIHYNGYQAGVKIRVNGNTVYDLYNGARLVNESNITVIDCFCWNDATLMPHKIKSSYQYSSQNKNWYYRRNYVAAMKALFPSISELNSKGTFFFAETQDWHNTPIGPLEYGNRFIHIDNCDIELITLNFTHSNSVNSNIRLTNNHFSSLATASTNFIGVANYPHNMYQQITVSNNRFDIPSATVTSIVQMQKGGQAGGGGFTGTVEIANNVGRFAAVTAFSDFTDDVLGYANMTVSIRDNSFVASSTCRLVPPGQNFNMFDASLCSGNYLNGSNLCIGQLWNTQGKIEIGATMVGTSPVILFEVGAPSIMNTATGSRYISICGTSGVFNNVKFTIGTSGSNATILFTDQTGTPVTKTTGLNNGTYEMQTSGSDGFNLEVVISSTYITVRTASSVAQRFVFSGYSI